LKSLYSKFAKWRFLSFLRGHQILKDAGKPLHAKEIAERIMEAGLWSSDGKTPEATVSACLYSNIKKHGDQSTFVKVAPQTFFLRVTQIVAVCDIKEEAPAMCRSDGRGRL